MRARVQKWGNSLAVRISKEIADRAGVHEEDELEIEVEADVIHLKRCPSGPTLDQLLDGITQENLHGEQDFGKAEGREA